MTWNHRILAQKDPVNGDIYFSVAECFYFRKGAKTPHSWTENPIAPIENTMKELKVTLRRMLKACDQPILEPKGKKLVRYTEKPRSSANRKQGDAS